VCPQLPKKAALRRVWRSQLLQIKQLHFAPFPRTFSRPLKIQKEEKHHVAGPLIGFFSFLSGPLKIQKEKK
jgi:hypothetical protein